MDAFIKRPEHVVHLFTMACVFGWTINISLCATATHAAHLVRSFGQKHFDQTAGIAVDRTTGYVYVADQHKCCVLIFDRRGRYKGRFGTLGKRLGQFLRPTAVATDGNGNVYVTDTGLYEKPSKTGDSQYITGPSQVERFDRQGHILSEIKLSTDYSVIGLAAHGPGASLAVAYLSDGTHLALYNVQLRNRRDLHLTWDSQGPPKLAADAHGFWMTAQWDMQHDRLAIEPTLSGSVQEQELVRIDSQGKVQKHVVLRIDGLIVAIAAGANGCIYLAECSRDVNEVGPSTEHHGLNRVLVFDRDLRKIAWFPTDRPSGIAVDPADNVYIANDHRVQVVKGKSWFTHKKGGPGVCQKIRTVE